MRIYTRIVLDMLSGALLESDDFNYLGPLAMCGDAGFAGAAVADAGVGGADGGAGDAGNADVSVGIPETDVSGDTLPEAEPDLEQEQQEPEPESEPEKPMLPKELTKALREMREAHPEHAKALRELQRAYFSEKAHVGVFATPEEALDAKATMEMLGGKDGIARMRSYEAVIHDIDNKVDQGDPSVIEDMARSSPDGFKKLVPKALETLATIDRIAYAETVRPLVLADLKGSGFVDYLNGAIAELKAGETERANRYLMGLDKWIKDTEAAETARQNRYQDPRLQEVQRREQEVRNQASTQLRETIESDLSNYLRDSVNRGISQLARDRRLSVDARSDVVNGVVQEVKGVLRGNDFYKQSMSSLMREGNREKIMNYARAQIDQVRQKAINTVWTRRYGSTQAPRRAAGSNGNGQPAQRIGASQGAASKPVPVAQRPSWQDVDMSKTSQDMYLNGQAYLRSGKFISWKRA